MKTTFLRIEGRVHGVGYRKFAARHAEDYGLVGFALNQKDGSLLIALQGDKDNIEAVLELLSQGPNNARVTSFEVTENELDKQYDEFIIAGPGYLHSDLESL